MRDIKTFNEIAFANVDKNGRRSLNMVMRQSMDNEKGGNGYVATTYSKDGKPYNYVRIGMDKAKSGPFEGKSQFDRVAEAAGWDPKIVHEVNESFDEIAAKEDGKERVVEALTNVSATIKGYPTKEDLANDLPQTVYYQGSGSNRPFEPNSVPKKGEDGKVIKDANGNDVYEDNKAKRSAHFGKIEDTITPYFDFDPEKNKQLVADRKEKLKAIHLAKKVNQQAKTEVGSPAAPDQAKDNVDVADVL